MGLFNFNINASQSNDDSKKLPYVEIFLNSDSIRITEAEAKGKTIDQLYQEFGNSLGDVSRIQRYTNSGRIIEGDSQVEIGMSYRATVASESKG